MSRRPTVLIIEDDPVFRRVLGLTIKRIGLSAEFAADGEIGFRRVLQGGIDFIVTDHQMPGISGVQLLQRFSCCTGLVRPPVVMCTAKGFELDTDELISRFKLTAVIHKPFSPRQLSDVILQYFREHPEEHTGASPQASGSVSDPEDDGSDSLGLVGNSTSIPAAFR